jgi:hypothetical protein
MIIVFPRRGIRRKRKEEKRKNILIKREESKGV